MGLNAEVAECYCPVITTSYVRGMIHAIAHKLNTVLDPDDLNLLHDVLLRVCEARGELETSPQSEKDAKLLIGLYQSSVRNRQQLLAMLTGKKFP